MNTRRTGNICQSNTAVLSNPWVPFVAGIMCVNHEDASHHYFMYLYFISPFLLLN
jgi:hypothetical protein